MSSYISTDGVQSIFSAMRSSEFGSVFEPNTVGSTVETVVLQIVHLCTLRSKAQFSTGIVAAMSAMTGGKMGPMLASLIGQFNALCADDGGPREQAEEFNAEDARIGFGTLLDNWGSLRSCALGKHVRRIFALTVCGALVGTELPEKFPRIYARAVGSVDVSKLDAWDILGEVLGTVRIVWDSTARCIVEQRWSALLGGDREIHHIESELAFIRANFDWYMVGSLVRTTTAGGEPVAEVDYITRVDKLHKTVCTAHKRAHHPAERLTLCKYMGILADMQARIREKRSRGTMRPEPFTVKLDGSTGTGKTAITVKLLRDILKIGGFPSSDVHITNVDPASKFMDGVTNITQGIYMDDVGNTLPAFQTFDENLNIIRIKNTAMTAVPKAAVEEKGGTYLDCKAFVISSNTESLHAPTTSVEPSSILRRFQYHVRVTIPPQFARPHVEPGVFDLPMLDASKLTQGMATQSQRFTIREWIPLRRVPDNSGVVRDNGRFVERAVDLTYGQMMAWLAPKIREHFTRQKKFVSDMSEDEQAPLCHHGYTTASHCHDCIHAVPVENAGDFVTRAFFPQAVVDLDGPPELARLVPCSSPSAINAERPSNRIEVVSQPPPAPTNRVWSATQRARGWAKEAWSSYVAVPEVAPAKPTFVGFIRAVSRGTFDVEECFLRSPHLLLAAVYGFVPTFVAGGVQTLFWITGLAGWSAFPVFFSFVWTVHCISHQTVQYVRGRVAGLTLHQLSGRLKTLATRQMGIMLGVVVSGLAFAALVHALRRPKENGGCASKGEANFIDAPPDPVAVDVKPVLRDLDVYRQLPMDWKTMTFDQVVERVARQLFVVEVHYAKSVVRSNALMVCTNYAIMPAHYFVRPDGTWSPISKVVFRMTTEERGPYFTIKIASNSFLRLSGDMMLVQTNVGGTMHNLVPLFTDEAFPGEGPVMQYHRDIESFGVASCEMRATSEVVHSARYGWSYKGYRYRRPQPTFVGLCGAILVSPGRWPRLLGLHTLGLDCQGMSCAVSKGDLEASLSELRTTSIVRSPIIEVCDDGLATPPGMESLVELTDLAEKSTLRTAPVGAPIFPYGTLVNFDQVRAKSRLGKSPISSLVTEMCGEVRKHGPPKNIGRRVVEETKVRELLGLSQIDPRILALAQQDLKDELVAAAKGCNLWRFFKPLSELEACSGVAQCVTINRVNLATAAGFPRTGPKHHLVVGAPTEELPDAIVLTSEMRAEVEELRQRMMCSKRVNFAFKGSHKDEATKLTKEKVRVFEGAPFAMTLLIRQYFLPIMRMYSLCMPFGESAVGINANGADWHEVMDWLMDYNPKQVVEGDWIHFDTSEAYQEIMAMFTIWIEVAEMSGNYSESEITLMWVLAEEIARHFAILKGDVGMLEGTNPSGNGVTVYINNGVNGLRKRCGFYALAPEEVAPVSPYILTGTFMKGASVDYDARMHFKPLLPQLHGRFADYVRAIFYGDDFLCAPRPEITAWFNQKTLEAWFSSQGKHMTAANKGPFETEMTLWEETTFLKRGVRPDHYTGAMMAPLAMDSIYKSLHVWPLKTPMSPKVHAADVIGGAIRELFQHGKPVFEERVPHLLLVADRFGARGFMPDIEYTYEAFASAWLAEFGDRVRFSWR